MHLDIDHYLLALRGELPMLALARQTLHHLDEVCPSCAAEANRCEASPLPLEPPAIRGPMPASDPHFLTRRSVDAAKAHLSQLRTVATKAREDLRLLLALPPDGWADRIANARTRLRSRSFVELLIEECRHRVRNEPRQAAELARLVPVALRWTQDRRDLPWVASLLARAAAHRANALRVAGDLPAAERLFAQLRRNLAERPLTDPAARAEIASLEASTRIDQRRFTDAEERLAAAADDHRLAAQPSGVAHVLLKTANLTFTLGKPQKSLRLLEQAAATLSSNREPLLLAAIVTCRVNALCDLERSAEARPLLDRHRDLYCGREDEHLAAIHTLLRGRVALGGGQLDDAETLLAEARDRLLALDRDYDAIVTSLYLADVLLTADKTADLQRLAADLVPLFSARDVARETLAALALLAKAAQAEGVTAAVLAEVRGRLQGGVALSA